MLVQLLRRFDSLRVSLHPCTLPCYSLWTDVAGKFSSTYRASETASSCWPSSDSMVLMWDTCFGLCVPLLGYEAQGKTEQGPGAARKPWLLLLLPRNDM